MALLIGSRHETPVTATDTSIVIGISSGMKEIELLQSDAELMQSEEGLLLYEQLPNESAKMALTVISSKTPGM